MIAISPVDAIRHYTLDLGAKLLWKPIAVQLTWICPTCIDTRVRAWKSELPLSVLNLDDLEQPFLPILLGRVWRWGSMARRVTVSFSRSLSIFLPLCLSRRLWARLIPSLCLAALEFFLCSRCGIVAPRSHYLVSQSWLPFPLLIGSKQHGFPGTLQGLGTFFNPDKKKKKKKKHKKKNNNTWLKLMPLTLHTVHNDKRCSDILVTGQSNAHS